MKRLFLLFIASALTVTAANAKISFSSIFKKVDGTPVKESNEKKQLSDAVPELDNIGTSDSTLDDINPDDVKKFYINIDDPHYQWTQSKTKSQQALMSIDGLVITNKNGKGFFKNGLFQNDYPIFASTVELPVVVESDDFIYGVVATATKLSEDKGYVLLFDYQDNNNFKAIIIDESQYKYAVFNGGNPSIVKTGLIKFPQKANNYTFYIKREGSNISFFIDNIEYGVFKNVTLTNSTFGVGVQGKLSITVLKLIFNVEMPESDTEQSTTQN